MHHQDNLLSSFSNDHYTDKGKLQLGNAIQSAGIASVLPVLLAVFTLTCMHPKFGGTALTWLFTYIIYRHCSIYKEILYAYCSCQHFRVKIILELSMNRKEENLVVEMEKWCSHVWLENDGDLMKWKDGKLFWMLPAYFGSSVSDSDAVMWNDGASEEQKKVRFHRWFKETGDEKKWAKSFVHFKWMRYLDILLSISWSGIWKWIYRKVKKESKVKTEISR